MPEPTDTGPRPEGKPSGPAPKLVALDALRGIAFLAVFSFHAYGITPGLPGWITATLSQGYFGVELFFCLSALTLCMSWDARRAGESRPYLAYLVRRFFRIAPLFYLAILGYRLSGWNDAGPAAIAATVTFTHGFLPATINRVVPGCWSIADEMLFYLFMPWLFFHLTTTRRALLATAGAYGVGALASRLVRRAAIGAGVPGYLASDFGWYWLPAQLGWFLLGITLYRLLRPRLRGEQAPGPRDRATSAALLLGALALAVGGIAGVLPAKNVLSMGVIAGLVAGLVLHPWPLLVNPATRMLGIWSFSAYLTHFAALEAARRLGLEATGRPPLVSLGLVAVVGLSMTAAASALLSRLVERPGIRLGSMVVARLKARAGPVAAPRTLDEVPAGAQPLPTHPG